MAVPHECHVDGSDVRIQPPSEKEPKPKGIFYRQVLADARKSTDLVLTHSNIFRVLFVPCCLSFNRGVT